MIVVGELFLEVWNWLALHSPSLEEEAFASSPQVNHSNCQQNKEEKKSVTIESNGIKATNIIQRDK